MNIIVDADACPVKEIIIDVASREKINVVMICSIAHYTLKDYGKVQWIYVDSSFQQADIVIINQSHRGDIVITQDYGLASLVLNKGCRVLHHTGYEYTEDNIDELLFKRHLSSKIRKAGGKTKGPKPLSQKEKERFRSTLEKVVNELKEE